jgi:transcription elongation factor Elf1
MKRRSFLESSTRIEQSRKPGKCPSCGHSPLASILYGYVVGIDDGLDKKLEEGRIVLGGCCVSDDDPKWECTNCGLKIHKKFPESR